jgi:aquaporin Z
VVVQLLGGVPACLFLWAMFGKIGATIPGAHIDDVHAMLMEAVLTLGLVTTILGTASGAQNVGPLSAFAVAGYIALAGLWASPISGASMNPARSFGPDLVLGEFGRYWVYVTGPIIGMLMAVFSAYVLRGPGGNAAAARAAQGTIDSPVLNSRAVETEGTTGAGGDTSSESKE